MNNRVITMLNCPYCETEWITEFQLTCDKCKSEVEADMLLTSLLQSIESLNNLDFLNQNRIKILDEAVTKLRFLKNKFQDV